MDPYKLLLVVVVAVGLYLYFYVPKPTEKDKSTPAPTVPAGPEWVAFDNPVAGATGETGGYVAKNCFNTTYPLINATEHSPNGQPPWTLLLWIGVTDKNQRLWLDLGSRRTTKAATVQQRVHRIRIVNTSLPAGTLNGDDASLHGIKTVRIYLLRERPSNVYGADKIDASVLLFDGEFPRNAAGTMDYVELELTPQAASRIAGRYLVLDAADCHHTNPGQGRISVRRVEVATTDV